MRIRSHREPFRAEKPGSWPLCSLWAPAFSPLCFSGSSLPDALWTVSTECTGLLLGADIVAGQLATQHRFFVHDRCGQHDMEDLWVTLGHVPLAPVFSQALGLGLSEKGMWPCWVGPSN
jgi:hypothetical protein